MLIISNKMGFHEFPFILLVQTRSKLAFDSRFSNPPICELRTDSIVLGYGFCVLTIATMMQEAVARGEHASSKPVSFLFQLGRVIAQQQQATFRAICSTGLVS